MVIKKNKKGQLIFVSFMFAVTIIVLALAWAFPIREAVDNTRTSMDCSNTSISNFDKAGCLVSDMTIFYFIGGLIAMVGIVIGTKIAFT